MASANSRRIERVGHIHLPDAVGADPVRHDRALVPVEDESLHRGVLGFVAHLASDAEGLHQGDSQREQERTDHVGWGQTLAGAFGYRCRKPTSHPRGLDDSARLRAPNHIGP